MRSKEELDQIVKRFWQDLIKHKVDEHEVVFIIADIIVNLTKQAFLAGGEQERAKNDK